MCSNLGQSLKPTVGQGGNGPPGGFSRRGTRIRGPFAWEKMKKMSFGKVGFLRKSAFFAKILSFRPQIAHNSRKFMHSKIEHAFLRVYKLGSME